MEFKVIRSEDGMYYNPKKDKFQVEFSMQCLTDEAFANLMITAMVDCKIETYELVKKEEEE